MTASSDANVQEPGAGEPTAEQKQLLDTIAAAMAEAEKTDNANAAMNVFKGDLFDLMLDGDLTGQDDAVMALAQQVIDEAVKNYYDEDTARAVFNNVSCLLEEKKISPEAVQKFIQNVTPIILADDVAGAIDIQDRLNSFRKVVQAMMEQMPGATLTPTPEQGTVIPTERADFKRAATGAGDAAGPGAGAEEQLASAQPAAHGASGLGLGG